MKDIFNIKVNETYDFSLSPEDLSSWDIKPKDAHSYHLINREKNYDIKVENAVFQQKEYRISINGNSYTIRLKDSLDQLVDAMGLSLGKQDKETDVKAPMPGLILDVMVQVGQAVKAEEPLLILEAMKMENIITAPNEGVIQEILVKKGDAVDKKDLLIAME